MSTNNQRRNFIKTGLVGAMVAAVPYYITRGPSHVISQDKTQESIPDKKLTNVNSDNDHVVKDNLERVRNFEKTFLQDVFLQPGEMEAFKLTHDRFLRLRSLVGFANFNLIGFDEALKYARHFPRVGEFTRKELVFIEKIFFSNADKYGFYGKKVINELTATVSKSDTIKIPGSGHYLFRGEPLKVFRQLEKDVGHELILTSGIRSVVKQIQLFLGKLEQSDRNISRASRSLAPPGHSYHGIGDFDVGKRGYGILNFTSQFAETEEYKRLSRLSYIDIRYTQNNQLGVRYEPWHIKVV